MSENFLRLRTFTCDYIPLPDQGLQCDAECHSPELNLVVPEGPTIGDQVTEFFDNEDAWPISQSLTIVKDAKRVTHVFTLAWMPRTAYEKMQAEITVRAKQIFTDSVGMLDSGLEDDESGT